MSAGVTVLRTGPLGTVVDLGRPGHAEIGVPPSGALDVPALLLANRLVGNPETSAGLELVLGGAEIRADVACIAAVTGPPVGVAVHVDPKAVREVGSHRAVRLAPGDRLVIGTPSTGLRSYVALAGGIDVPPVLGSRSTDLLTGLGPRPLRSGDVLPLGRPVARQPDGDVVPSSEVADEHRVAVLLGPRADWFVDPATALRAGRWTVSPTSNRIGVRCEGTVLDRVADRRGSELPSEPMLTGAIQVPPDGRPVIFLADHPTTGGYPVIGVVPEEDLPVLAQARPGSTLLLVPASR